MAETVPNITVPFDQYLDLNTASGIAVGTAMQVFNRGTQHILIQESAAQPLTSSNDGVELTNTSQDYADCTVEVGSLTIWVKSASDNKAGLVSVQEI